MWGCLPAEDYLRLAVQASFAYHWISTQFVKWQGMLAAKAFPLPATCLERGTAGRREGASSELAFQHSSCSTAALLALLCHWAKSRRAPANDNAKDILRHTMHNSLPTKFPLMLTAELPPESPKIVAPLPSSEAKFLVKVEEGSVCTAMLVQEVPRLGRPDGRSSCH